MKRGTTGRAALALALAGAFGAAGMSAMGGVGCTPEWQSGYHLSGIEGTVYDSVYFNGQLYVSGQFLTAGGIKTGGIARWNGSNWEAVGGTFKLIANNGAVSFGRVESIAVYNGELYAGGSFNTVGDTAAKSLARWDGTTWQAVGGGLGDATWGANTGSQSLVHDMVVHNGALYIGGLFDYTGSVFLRSLAKWDGTNLAAIGPISTLLQPPQNAPVEVYSLASYNGELYVGGSFASGAGVSNTGNFGKWNGTSWSSAGTTDINTSIRTMMVFDEDGAGVNPAVLVAGGTLTKVGIGLAGSPTGVDVRGVAKWNGTSWAPFGAGLSRDANVSADIAALAVFDTGNGPRLIAAGYGVYDANYVPIDSQWQWNGTTWEQLPGGPNMGFINTLCVGDLDGAGPQGNSLVAGGVFNQVGNTPAVNIARLHGSTWSPMPEGGAWWVSDGSALNTGRIVRMVTGDEDGNGPAQPTLYMYGNMDSIGGTLTPSRVARLDGDEWTALGNTPGLTVASLVFFNDGTGTRPFAISVWGTIHKWNGTTWTQVGAIPEPFYSIFTAVVFDPPGAAPAAIYISGHLLTSGEPQDFRTGVVKFDGSTITPVTSVSPTGLDPRQHGHTMHVHNNALYVNGLFKRLSDDASFTGVARYDGTDWTLVGESDSLSINGMASFQGKLYVGGQFNSIGGLPIKGIASYDTATSTWAALGSGLTGTFMTGSPFVYAVGVGDDGTGEALFLGGTFTTAGNVAGTRSAAKWNGSAFTALSTGLISERIIDGNSPGSRANSIASLGNMIYFAGQFNKAGGVPSSGFAAWGCEGVVCPADFNGDNARDVADLFAYINAWLAKTPNANFNGDGGVDVADLFAYINAWLAGC